MPMKLCANGLSLSCTVHGAPSAEALLLIMGWGALSAVWPRGFIATLVERGFQVIEFDNRDSGASAQLASSPQGGIKLVWLKYLLGLRVASPYSLADMARDAAGVLDALGIARAHVCGISMGGMIAQHLAARCPDRVLSLSLLSTTSGRWGARGPTLRGLLGLVKPSAFPMSEADQAESKAVFESAQIVPAAVERQGLAIAADRGRAALLHAITAPTYVMHGRRDASIPFRGGIDLARRIRGAVLDLIDELGHELPRQLWPRIADGISAAAARSRRAPEFVMEEKR
ncbi:alpha/beta fold hydrolase [Roseateles violae]|uniref:Alpha/beta fold hydrolase n=1 Tax=Roseateles violae TaxID=3058042 RepID=A0ABT8DT55_9BURK|nr:alpha/beta fold hydrolase [Pelomonas sp. PFR6]MDN3921490.1 alpha/beta fold hydrolase [Pelomonas sp. PFR6]